MAPVAALTSSQFEIELVFVLTEKLIGVPSVLVKAKFCNEETVAPAGEVSVSALGLTSRSAVLLTTRVTGSVCGGPALPFGVIVIVPE